MKTARQIFRDNLIKHMVMTGVHASDLSKWLNFDRTAVYKYTSGKSLPPIPVLWMIARELNTTMDELMEGYAEEMYYEEVKC